MIQTIFPTPAAKSSEPAKPEAVPNGFAALMEPAPTPKDPVAAEAVATAPETSGDTPAIEPDGEQIGVSVDPSTEGLEAALMAEGAEATHSAEKTPNPQLAHTDADPRGQVGQDLQGVAAVGVDITTSTVQPTQSTVVAISARDDGGQKPTIVTGPNGAKVASTAEAMTAPQRPVQNQAPFEVKPEAKQALTPQIAANADGVDTSSGQSATNGAKGSNAIPQSIQANTLRPDLEAATPKLQGATPTTASSDKSAQPLQGTIAADARDQQSGAVKAVINTSPVNPTQERAKPATTQLHASNQPTIGLAERSIVPGHDTPLTGLPQTVPPKPTGTAKDAFFVETSLQDGRTVERPVSMSEIFAKTNMLAGLEKSVGFVGKPANGSLAPMITGDPEQMVQPPLLTAAGLSAEGIKVSASSEASVKSPAKPFAEALMSQIKSVDVTQGRTTVNLVPRGLGSIEIEVLSENDGAAKVVVRVENPAVLQALRDDRQFLAEAIGVSDSSIFDFQEHSAGEQSDPQQENSSQGSDTLADASILQPQDQHLDVVGDGQLDIMT